MLTEASSNTVILHFTMHVLIAVAVVASEKGLVLLGLKFY